MKFPVLAAALALVLVAPVFAADDAKPKKKAPKPIAWLEGIDLTEEQKKEVADIQADIAKKTQELQKELKGVIPADVQKAAQEKIAAAKAEGKKGKALQEVTAAAYDGLTAEQKAKRAELDTKIKELQGELRTRVLAVLNAEQKKAAEAKLPMPKKKKDAA